MILIENAKYILGEKILKNQNIIIDEGKIVYIGEEKDKTDYVIDAKKCIVSPGLINTHTHAAMTLLRGIADDMQLDKWLKEKIWPIEDKLTEDHIYWGTLLACAEMIKSGTTSFIDMYFHINGIVRAVEKSGMRALITQPVLDFFKEDKLKDEVKRLVKAVRISKNIKENRIQIGFGPHAPYTCSKNLLYEVKYLAKKHNMKIHMHISETRKEVEDIIKMYKMRPVEFLESLNFLDENVILAHGIWLSPDEIEILKKRKVTISHCPVSNMKLASGIAPVYRLHKNGIPITLGTDGPASNNTLNILETMKISSLLYRVASLDPTFPSKKDVFKWATKNAGKFLGISGELKEGSEADLILIDLKSSNMVPVYDPLSHIIYSANPENVVTSIIDGKIVMENRELKTINEDFLVSKVNEIKESLI